MLKNAWRLFFALGVILLPLSAASAEVIEKQIDYSQAEAKLHGFEFSDSNFKSKSPGVIIFSDWMGVGDFAKSKAKELVRLGYRVFVADIYGDGRKAADQSEASQLATKYKSDRSLFRSRVKAAYDTFLKNPSVDQKRIAAIGFCFGGTASIELARSGVPVAGIVSFHGGLDSPQPELGRNIKGRVLVLHGADDPYVSRSDLDAFEEEMRQNKVDWEMVKYGNSVHSFTNPEAGSDNSKGAAYNEKASNRSFKAMRDFFSEIFQ